MAPRVRSRLLSTLHCAALCTLFSTVPSELVSQSTGDSTIAALERNVRLLERAGTPGELGVAWLDLSEAYHRAARRADVIDATRAAIPLLVQAGKQPELALAENRLGLTHWHLARYDSAIVHLNIAREIWTELGDTAHLSRNYNTLGAAHYQWGNIDIALDAYLRALRFRRAAGDTSGAARILTNLGVIYHDLGLYDRALQTLEEAIRTADLSGSGFAQGYSRQELAQLYLTLQDWGRAKKTFEVALERFGPGNWPPSNMGLAMAYVGQGNPGAAIPRLQAALAATAKEDQRQEVRALFYLGRAYRALGDYTTAIHYLERGVEEARQWEQRPLALSILTELADLHELKGDAGRALAHLRAQVALRDSVHNLGAANRIAAIEARLEAERKEQENQRLQAERQVREAIISRQRVIVLLAGALLVASALLIGLLIRFNRKERERAGELARANGALEATNARLQQTLAEVRTLKGLIPICASCKRIRDDQGYWESVESYISARSDAFFSHSMCNSCGPQLYGEDWTAAMGDLEREASEGG